MAADPPCVRRPAVLYVDRAPAKINLTLHINGRRADGWHELESLVAFTRGGDTLALRPGADLALTVVGPTATAAGTLDDNLVIRAARALAARVDGLTLGAFHLTKRLPVAAGIGGGSSDAAAALRLLARANGLSRDDPRLRAAATATGADVSVCLDAIARVMTGVGDTLGAPIRLPPLPTLVVNPGIALETRRVFARMGLAAGSTTIASAHPDFTDGQTSGDLIQALRRGRNDMEDAACVLAPIVADVLAVLAAAPGCRLARMSGSGATCFGLFGDCRAVARAGKSIRSTHPDWWVKPAMLG